ncbi:MAG: STAS domain-containing protein [Nitrospira sp.]|nr:STAS domain-containing protein [Nitrospira sp.]MBP6604401.1 STAS domain-containing protein [Nitrospira sp.]HQY57498.1 STAS domain-containing protein [Nitrospira sp.]HRA95977.1 STAS domain-containing protein [Nitrospira sp.]
MKITQEVRNTQVTLKLEGNFTYTQRKPFQEALKAVGTNQVDEIVIDLSQVAFLDSAALGLLMISHRQLQAEKRTLSLAYPQPTVRQIIELANLHKTIPVIEAQVSSMVKKSA